MSSESFNIYANRLGELLTNTEWAMLSGLAEDLLECWRKGKQVFLCGNGGSAGNSIHLANDFVYGVARETGKGIRAISLAANPAILTCLANDTEYESIFSEQLAVQGMDGDVLIVLSGSGNSPNVLAAMKQAKKQNIKTYAIVGYSGGQCSGLADCAIHFPVNDMQMAEDLQLVVGHMLMQWLYEKRHLINGT